MKTETTHQTFTPDISKGGIRNICVYCGSSGRAGDVYKNAAIRMGEIIGLNKRCLVYGGGKMGLMGLVADHALKNGGEVIGIIPRHIESREVGHTGLTELHVVETMHERKQMMVDRSDAFAVLPGGLGTLDEFFEIMTWRQLGLHDKPIVVVNINGYWDKLLSLIDGMVEAKFALDADRQCLQVVTSVDEALNALDCAPRAHIDPKTKWI